MKISREKAFIRGATGHCPRCGHNAIFKSSFRLLERCPKCNLPLELEDGWSYGSVPLSYSITCLFWVLPVAILAILEIISHSNAIYIGLAGVLIIPIATFKYSKQLWIGIYYSLLAHELEVKHINEKGDDH